MKKVLRFLSVLMVMSACVTVSHAADYRHEWETVDSLLEQDRPESAYNEVASILLKATQKGDSYQMLKSHVYMINIGSEYREDYVAEAFAGLHALIPSLKDEYLPLGWALLGNCYEKYYSENKYSIRNRSHTETVPDDMKLWDESVFLDTIYTCFLNSITINVKACRKADALDYKDLVKPGNEEGGRIMPSLYDALLWNAVDFRQYESSITDEQAAIFHDERLYSMDTFSDVTAEYRAKGLLLRDLSILEIYVRNYADEPDIERHAMAMETFFAAIADYAFDDNLSRSIKEQGELLLPKHPISAEFIAGYASLDGKDDIAARVALCRKAEQAWPGSRGAVQCHNWILEVESPTLEINAVDDLASSNPMLLGITYSNVSKIWFVAVKCDRESPLTLLNQMPAECSWDIDVENPGDYSKHSTLFTVPDLAPGYHYIIASTSPDFDIENSVISDIYVNVCSFEFVNCTAQRNGISGFVADRMTGRPVNGCSYRLFRMLGSWGGMKKELVATGMTGADGLVNPDMAGSADGQGGRYQLELEKEGQSTSVQLNVPYVADMSGQYTANVYTDRYTYRPGETVRFNCIVYRTDGYSEGQTVKDCRLQCLLIDANYQNVDTLNIVTDAFGTAAGSFTIPRNLLPGRFLIEARININGVEGVCQINVEEFRQPTFQIEMEGVTGQLVMGDTAVVMGTATTYTGVPVGGAKVSYTVNCRSVCFRPRLMNAEKQIVSGESVTASDGTFRIKFPAESGIAFGNNYNAESLDFTVTAKVTDLNGETHTAVTSIHTGRDIQYARVTADPVSVSAPVLYLTVKDGSDRLIAGKVDVTIERLVTQERPLLDIMKSFSKVHTYNDYIITPELRARFPMYDFDRTGKEKWQVADVAYRQTIDVPAGETYTLRLPEALATGTYRVRAEMGGMAGQCDTITIASISQDNESMPDNSLLLAKPVRTSYNVGDVAEILVGSAFPDAIVYYVVEDRSGVVDKGTVTPGGKVTTLRVPVTGHMKGGFNVSFGTIYQKAFENASCRIDVPFSDKELDISLVTFRDMLEPDRTETWELCIRDADGRPVDASLMLSMYDSALDVYGPNSWFFQPWDRWSRPYVPTLFRGSVIWPRHSFPRLKYLAYKEYPEIAKVVSPLANYSAFAATRETMHLRGAASPSLRSTYAGGISMDEFEGLGITTADEAFQGRVTGLDIAFNSAAVPEAGPVPADGQSPEIENLNIRMDMNPTAFFISNMRTDENGRVKFSFTTPQLLTRWNFQGLAHTADLKWAFFKEQVTTRKELMIQPRAPRFVRQGDTFEFSSKLMNVTEQDINAAVCLEIFDPVTSKALGMIIDNAVKKVLVPAGQSAEVSFRISVPGNIDMFEYRITASSARHTDGQQELIPVLSSRAVVTESVSLFNNGSETRSFELKALSENRLSGTASNRTLTLEYTPSPIWYAIQALPYLAQEDNPSNERLFHRYFANALTLAVLGGRPAVGRMLDKWAEIPADSWQTQLEKNQDLKQTLLQEMPWVLDSKSEKENLRRLAEAFTKDKAESEQQAALKQLLERQNSGGWSWIPGNKPDFWVTGTIVSGIGQLVRYGYLSLDSDPKLKNAMKAAMNWLDNQTWEYYSKTNRNDIKSVTPRDLDWLLAHAYMSDIDVAKGCRDIYDFLLKTATVEDSHDLSLYTRASLALLMDAVGNKTRAAELVTTLVERSLYDDEQGRWWRDNVGGYMWHEAPVETQSRIIQALISVDGYNDEAAECARWLLKQKQTTHWATSPATAQAVVSLLLVGDIQGKSLDNPAVSYITIGSETIKAGGSDADAGYTIRKWQEPDDSSMGRVSVRNDSPQIGWGALSIQYTDEMAKIPYSENGISLKRALYRVDEKDEGTTLHSVADGESLHVGDRLRIRIELSCDRNLEYVQLKDMRAASFEPVSTHAGFSYNWHDDLRTYVVPENASQVFYIDRLSRGSYIVEYDVYAEQEGTFSSGIVSAQCMYAPEFRSTASSANVTVGK